MVDREDKQWVDVNKSTDLNMNLVEKKRKSDCDCDICRYMVFLLMHVLNEKELIGLILNKDR